MIDRQTVRDNLQAHLHMLTRTTGERSARRPANHERAAAYIQSCFKKK